MATKSNFDPEDVDSEFYSHDPNQHGDSDYGRESDGVGNAQYNSVSGMDKPTDQRNYTYNTREANVGEGKVEKPVGESYDNGTMGWDVNPEAVEKGQQGGHMMSDEAAAKLRDIAENPSDEALFDRNDATYLEDGDDPNRGYDPHNKGYSNNPKEQGSDR